ncbi:right-handed parallel beta-helix repeat-containing protein [bacterium]|nr:right-handed parallel beta-helix repeat-containing protein [bacterium]
MRFFEIWMLAALVSLIASGCQTAGAGQGKAPTVYVAGDGSGDFNCTGTSDSAVINAALIYAATHPGFKGVHLKGPHVYHVNDTIVIDSNMKLSGDATAVLRLVDHADWPRFKPMVKSRHTADTESGRRAEACLDRNIEICGFEIDGNDKNNADLDDRDYPRLNRKSHVARYGGSYWYGIFTFYNVENLRVHHMKLHNNMNDILKTYWCRNVEFDHCTTYMPGHDGWYCVHCENVSVHDNSFRNRINCAVRFNDSNHCKGYNNDITIDAGGSNGFQIQRGGSGVMNDIEIYGNYFHGHRANGVRAYGPVPASRQQASNVHIHNNIFYRTSGSGVGLSNFYDCRVENNTFVECGGSGISVTAAPQPGAAGANAIVKNNIIVASRASAPTTGTRARREAGPSGVGISAGDTKGNVIASFNCFFNNPGGDTSGSGIESSRALSNVDPKFVNPSARDFRLQPGSPCIGAGEADGKKVDLGAYGNMPKGMKPPKSSSVDRES